MILRGLCRYCQDKCEWIVDEAGNRSPDHACAKSPTGACEPVPPEAAMAHRIGRDVARRAGQRARGFSPGGKRRPG